MSPITHYTKLSKYMQGFCNGKYRGMLGLVWHRRISGFWGLVGNQDTPNPEKTKKIRVIPVNGWTNPLYPFRTPDHRSITRLPLSPFLLILTRSPIIQFPCSLFPVSYPISNQLLLVLDFYFNYFVFIVYSFV